jgi:type I restriction enzyme S subunit
MNFELRPLGELCLHTVETTDPKLTPERNFWYVDISAVDNVQKRIASPQRVSGKSASVRARQVVRTNDVIVATTRPNLNAVALVTPEYDGEVCSTGFCVLRPGDELDADYLFSFVRSRAFIEPLADLTKGALYPAVTDKQVFAQIIPWVPLDEQRRIAARLKAQLAEVETARQAAQCALRDAGLLRTNLIDAAFSACDQWQSIGAVAKVQSGYAFKSEDFTTSGVRLLRNANVLPGKVYWDDTVYIDASEVGRYPSYILAAGDVLISLDRPLISSGIKVARVGEADLPALLLQRVGRFVLKQDEIDADFLYAFLQSSRFIDAISGHDQSLGVPHISPGQVESIEIPLLPLDDQRRIVGRLKQQLAEADAIVQAAAAQLAEIECLPQRLLARAFTPQGDVI